VRDWAGDTPEWLEVLSPKNSLNLAQLEPEVMKPIKPGRIPSIL
jgi:hypothetical protein